MRVDNDSIILGTLIKEFRHREEISANVLIKRLPFSGATYYQIERCAGNPKWTTVVSILEALDVPLKDFGREYDRALLRVEQLPRLRKNASRDNREEYIQSVQRTVRRSLSATFKRKAKQ
jgi:DNA-binding XRE family transcriptional regulator